MFLYICYNINYSKQHVNGQSLVGTDFSAGAPPAPCALTICKSRSPHDNVAGLAGAGGAAVGGRGSMFAKLLVGPLAAGVLAIGAGALGAFAVGAWVVGAFAATGAGALGAFAATGADAVGVFAATGAGALGAFTATGALGAFAAAGGFAGVFAGAIFGALFGALAGRAALASPAVALRGSSSALMGTTYTPHSSTAEGRCPLSSGISRAVLSAAVMVSPLNLNGSLLVASAVTDALGLVDLRNCCVGGWECMGHVMCG